MKTYPANILTFLVLWTTAVRAEELPWERLLTGDAAKQAAALEERIGRLEAGAKFAEAVAPAKEVLGLRERLQGRTHWQTADARRKLDTLRVLAEKPAAVQKEFATAGQLQAEANLRVAKGRYAEAEPLYRKALAIREQVLGPKHLDTGLGYTYLAISLNGQGKYRDAELLFRKDLAIQEEVQEPKHPDTAACCFHLAATLHFQGKYADAEPLSRRALAIAEEVLGPKNISTAQCCDYLAGSLNAQGKHTDAEALYRQALAIHEEVLGPKHRNTAMSYNNLGVNLNDQGKYTDAEPLFRRALAVREEVLGAKHPATSESRNNLAVNLDAQGKHVEAEPLLRQALAVCEEVLGPKHPDTARGYNNLALNLNSQKKYTDAEAMYRKALAICEGVLGPRHPLTATTYNNQAVNLDAQGKYTDAEALHRKALAICEEVLGAKHPHTALSCDNLAVNLDHQGKHVEAESLLRQARAIREEVLGPKHPETARGYYNLAYNLDAQGKYKDAEASWRSAVEAVEVARLHLSATGFGRAAAAKIFPFLGLALNRARQEKATDAWEAAEAGLARGLLDDLAATALLARTPEELRRFRERAGVLAKLQQALLPLLAAEKLTAAAGQRRDELVRQRAALVAEIERDAAERARGQVCTLTDLQSHLPADAALVFWFDWISGTTVDPGAWHYGCVVRPRGVPVWVRLPGSGRTKAWSDQDDPLSARFRDALARRADNVADLAGQLAAQRLTPLEPHLAATQELPAVRRLVVVPVGSMAGVPLEALTDRYLVSYAPSGTVFARLTEKHRPLRATSLLALGDPVFTTSDAAPTAPAPKALPGTRREVTALAALFPKDKTEVLLGSDAGEQKLDALIADGRLKRFRLLHFATHGDIRPDSAWHSALLLARDRLPDDTAATRPGVKRYDGRLTVETLSGWQLDADLVTLSACETGLGAPISGEGFLGFTQVLFKVGARSLVLSLWKVDDTATALLMTRFYENLLGQREGLKAPLPRAEALREAKQWLRELSRKDAESLAVALGKGELRGSVSPLKPLAEPPKEAVGQKGDRPFAHPYYWSAFILLGDPD
jgi:CHAT domain-containing protein/tetratricopeptide (TPR) repeat protein